PRTGRRAPRPGARQHVCPRRPQRGDPFGGAPPPPGGIMNPYFDTSHLAGALLLVPVLAWGVMEASHLDNSREGATKVGGAGRRMAAWPFLIAASAVLYLAPPLVPASAVLSLARHLVPAAAIRPGAVAFAIGLVILRTGLVLRGWSILTLGTYF